MNGRRKKYLVFDLGGVIINLDIERTINQLARLGNATPDFIKEQYANNEWFKRHEVGAIGDDEFREFIRDFLDFKGSDSEIDMAWNGMILDIPADRLELLRTLQHEHELFLLSNTNAIHMQRVHEQLALHGFESFDPFFKKQYYSHVVNMRKPNADIYEFVLDDNNLDPQDVLFIDDNADNIRGAANLGIHTLHVNSPQALMNFFNG